MDVIERIYANSLFIPYQLYQKLDILNIVYQVFDGNHICNKISTSLLTITDEYVCI